MSNSRHWSQTPTERYIHTDLGVHDFKEVATAFWRIVDRNPLESDVQLLWAVIKAVFGKK